MNVRASDICKYPAAFFYSWRSAIILHFLSTVALQMYPFGGYFPTATWKYQRISPV